MERVKSIVISFVGRDMDALSVLALAAEKGKFEEFAERLEQYYKENLQYVHPEARRMAQVPGAIRAEAFFLNCYESLGIKAQVNHTQIGPTVTVAEETQEPKQGFHDGVIYYSDWIKSKNDKNKYIDINSLNLKRNILIDCLWKELFLQGELVLDLKN